MMVKMSRPVGIAVAGCGRVSDAHIGAICSQPELGRIVAVIDMDPEIARATASRWGAPHACTSLAEALAIGEVEAVDICLPNHLHGPASIECLGAGRHVLVEKPMADNGETAARMAAAAVAAGKVLAVGQSRRHSSAIRYVQDNARKWGELRSIQASLCVYFPGPQAPWWRVRTSEQGLVLSLLGSHTLDFVQMMLGH